MGLFDGVLGGVIGAGMVSAVNHVLEQHGGVQGVVSAFEQNGLGNTVKSWIGNGTNLPITADDLHKVIGSDKLEQIAQKLGINTQDLAAQLSKALPAAIDKLTPHGEVPKTA